MKVFSKFYILVISISVYMFVGCELKEEVITTAGDFRLTFSADTVHFDTLFSSIKSVTKRFRAINPSENAVNISRIYLRDNSNTYSLVIHGEKSNEIQDVFLRGGDSLLVLVEATVNEQNADMPFLLEEPVVFEVNGNQQEVILEAYGQDVVLHNKETITANTIWTANRPHVVEDSVLVEEGVNLIIEAGARIHFKNDSYMKVKGSLEVNGTYQDTVVFQGIRMEEDYLDVAGQWIGIVFESPSKGNYINNAFIKNAYYGIVMRSDEEEVPEEPAMFIENTTVENMGAVGIWLSNTNAKIYNTIVNNCQSQTLICDFGGRYDLRFNTFVNGLFDFNREEPSVFVSNVVTDGNGQLLALPDLSLSMYNNIFWGDLDVEFFPYLGQDEAGNVALNLNIKRNILKVNLEPDSTGRTISHVLGLDNLYNIDPLFEYRLMDRHFVLSEDSPARNAGISQGVVTKDKLGNERNLIPDLGALKWIPSSGD